MTEETLSNRIRNAHQATVDEAAATAPRSYADQMAADEAENLRIAAKHLTPHQLAVRKQLKGIYVNPELKMRSRQINALLRDDAVNAARTFTELGIEPSVSIEMPDQQSSGTKVGRLLTRRRTNQASDNTPRTLELWPVVGHTKLTTNGKDNGVRFQIGDTTAIGLAADGSLHTFVRHFETHGTKTTTHCKYIGRTTEPQLVPREHVGLENEAPFSALIVEAWEDGLIAVVEPPDTEELRDNPERIAEYDVYKRLTLGYDAVQDPPNLIPPSDTLIAAREYLENHPDQLQ